MKKKYFLLNNENGSVMVAAIMILVLLTIVGMAAMNTSTTETSLATNTLLYERAFYTAEAGFEHAKGVLKVPFTEANPALVSGGTGNWTFVLDGTGPIPGLDQAQDTDGDTVGDYAGAVTLLQSQLDGITYTVKIWNNDDSADGGDYKTDADGRIMVRTNATGPRGEVCSIEALIEGTSKTGNLEGYKAQTGAGAGKSYRNNDLQDIETFDWQVGNPGT
jgi:type IV pilus assembly protein PilX